MTPAFLFAALLWEPVRREAELFARKRLPPIQAMQLAGDAVIARQVKRVAVPKRFSLQSREIWEWQERLARSRGGRAFHLLEQQRFRAAYDFLLLRAQSGEAVDELAGWWQNFQQGSEGQRQSLVRSSGTGDGKKRRRRRRSPRKRPANPQS